MKQFDCIKLLAESPGKIFVSKFSNENEFCWKWEDYQLWKQCPISNDRWHLSTVSELRKLQNSFVSFEPARSYDEKIEELQKFAEMMIPGAKIKAMFGTINIEYVNQHGNDRLLWVYTSNVVDPTKAALKATIRSNQHKLKQLTQDIEDLQTQMIILTQMSKKCEELFETNTCV